MSERGVSAHEVEQVVAHGQPSNVKTPRLGREMLFAEGYSWKGKRYPHKLVRAIYIEEGNDIVIVTVLSYYGEWEVWE